MLQKRVHDHKTLRRDVGIRHVLTHAGMPSPAASLCATFIGKPTALSSLNLRLADMHCHETRLDATKFVPLLNAAHDSTQLLRIQQHTATWSYEHCIWMKRLLERVVARLVTAANGRGHPINTKQRNAAYRELDDFLLDVWGYNWRHRGLC